MSAYESLCGFGVGVWTCVCGFVCAYMFVGVCMADVCVDASVGVSRDPVGFEEVREEGDLVDTLDSAIVGVSKCDGVGCLSNTGGENACK